VARHTNHLETRYEDQTDSEDNITRTVILPAKTSKVIVLLEFYVNHKITGMN